ncbi:constitutive coactivator of PPAR-gamma-like protein 1 [Contarinia nasturtii]|uniref:constitutive coactivator of PPAR-gamma-like protein 1 n=1 Tax=Contarinia nasturtii TaxID=265458 RepID=UPI0012D39A5B|nr:constitutive coactivator of PPAR-gamma-like protein 1 [Contarinia nasturtii]
MGVRGLKTFLERNNQIHPINIDDEVKNWKSAHPQKTPIIVVDFLSLAIGITTDKSDAICGGRHQIVLNSWKKLLDAFQATGCELVFFSDLGIQEAKIDVWNGRRDQEFQTNVDLYNMIEHGLPLSRIVAENDDKCTLKSLFYGMAQVARRYGEFHYSTKYECDLEIAQYAKQHNCLAVITNDTDFLIFDGAWKLWSPSDVRLTPANRLTTVEYNRNSLANKCLLSQNQLPLFATLIGNDFTHGCYDQLGKFHGSLGPFRMKFQNVANFVRLVWRANLTDSDIQKIVVRVFGYADDEKNEMIKNSIKSYDTNFIPAAIDDPIEEKLQNTALYRIYMDNMCPIYGSSLGFYDMRGSEAIINIPKLLNDWIKRRKGILLQRYNNKSLTFTLLAKRNVNENCLAYTETPIYPDFEVPIDDLYVENEELDDIAIIEIRWKLFGWIMSFSEEVISTIKKLPQKYLLISTILYALVKEGIFSIEEADGILYTEYKVYLDETGNAQYPNVLVTRYVRAAHIYNNVFSQVRHNFGIAGLLPSIEEVMQFDGVFFQKLMEKMTKMKITERENLMAPLQKYRIHALDFEN